MLVSSGNSTLVILQTASLISLSTILPTAFSFAENCRTVFDDPEPGFILLPTDLEYFIQFKDEDFKRRQTIVDVHQQEQQEVRNVPPESDSRRKRPSALHPLFRGRIWIAQLGPNRQKF
jgi:hypothetical protein